jgi:tetratricopeptide (TPR) repeat protein
MVSALHNKALVLKQLGRFEESLKAADAAINLSPKDPDNWQRKAEALKKLRRRKEAREAETQVARLRGEM